MRKQLQPIPTHTRTEIYPLTPDRWQDLTRLFGKDGAQGGCWCMWWRWTPREYKQYAGVKNRQALQKMVKAGKPTGLLAYADGHAVGWCSVAPREQFIRLRTSATWKPIDSQSVWSIVCFYVAAAYRGQQMASGLLRAAIDYARVQGAEVVEAYLKDIGTEPVADRALYFGTVSMFKALGFREVARRHPGFPIVRLRLRKQMK